MDREYLHEGTGMRVLFVQAPQAEKCFSLQFRTLPESDNGVARVLEHALLSGSQKYPLKEAFGELLKGSLSTFINAMTFPDRTVYPFATTNEQEFINLLEVSETAVLERLTPYLEIFTERRPVAAVQARTKFQEPKRVSTSYVVTEKGPMQDWSALAFAHGEPQDLERNLGLKLLLDALFYFESSPLRRQLLETGLLHQVQAQLLLSGGISISPAVYVREGEARPYLEISAKALDQDLPALIALI